MKENWQHLEALHDIKHIMERSSRFISLSGLSGIAAGTCALVGVWFAYNVIHKSSSTNDYTTTALNDSTINSRQYVSSTLLQIAIVTFITAFVLAFIFTYLRSKKSNTPIWGTTARRLIMNVSIPMLVGGIYLLKLMENESYGLIAPGCLIFYGLALVNAGKYTLSEVRYLGYGQIILGVINLWFPGQGLYFWAAGFGVLHIIYGALMWWKYERSTTVSSNHSME